MKRMLLVALALLVPLAAHASGVNVPQRPLSVLIIVADDLSASQLQGFDVQELDAIEIPAFDGFTLVTETRTAPMCGPSRVALNSMSHQTQTWNPQPLGRSEAPTWGLAWIPRHLAGKGIDHKFFGKAHFTTYSGYCQDDLPSTVACSWDSDCTTGSCLYHFQPDDDQGRVVADIGWDYDGWIPANASTTMSYFNWDHVTTAKGADVDSHVNTVTPLTSTYKEDFLVGEFLDWWNDPARSSRRFAIYNSNLPHEHMHLPDGESPVGACLTSASTSLDCFEPMVDHLYNDIIPSILASLDMDTTCVVVVPDNGAENRVGTTPSQGLLRGEKGSVWDGGILTGSIWSPACFGGRVPDSGIEISIVDIARAGLELLNAYDPTLWADTTSNPVDTRTATARANHTSDLMGWLTGVCSKDDCYPNRTQIAHYAYDLGASGDDPDRAVTKDGYKLAFTYRQTEHVRLFAVADESTALCQADTLALCRAELTTNAQRDAFDALAADLAYLDAGARPSDLFTITWEAAQDPLVSGINTFYVHNNIDGDYNASFNAPDTIIVCDMDWDDGSTERIASKVTQDIAVEGAFDSSIALTHTYTTPATYDVSGECWNMYTPDDRIAVGGSYTLAGGGGGSGGVVGAYASTFDDWDETCGWNTSPGASCVAEDGSTQIATLNGHALVTGAQCLGGAGKCVAFNNGCPGSCPAPITAQNNFCVLLDWPGSGNAPGDIGGGAQTLSAWFYFPSGWINVEGNRYKLMRWYDASQDIAVVTLQSNGALGIKERDQSDQEVGVSIDDHRNEWIHLEATINPTTGGGSLIVRDSAGAQLGTTATYVGQPAVMGATITRTYVPMTFTTDPLPSTINYPEENLHYLDNVCACKGLTCGVGGTPDVDGNLCDTEFPDA